jgi:hypothetical protein
MIKSILLALVFITGLSQASILRDRTFNVVYYNQVTLNELAEKFNTTVNLTMDFDPENIFTFRQTKTQKVSGNQLESQMIIASRYTESKSKGKDYVQIPWTGSQASFTYNNEIFNRLIDRVEFVGGKFKITSENKYLVLEREAEATDKGDAQPFIIKLEPFH